LIGDEPATFRKWLHTRRKRLGGKMPMDYLEAGEIRLLAGYVYSVVTGQPD
jgi:hypothetical protein